jgi:predicted alpha/beta-fold hydrolase
MQVFQPSRWLSNPHIQTIWPRLFKVPINIKLSEERIELTDGDFLDVVWSNKESDHIVIIIHGLEGSLKSQYARRMINAITERGWQCVFMHFRGCSKEHNRLDRSYHSGDTEDINYFTNLIKSRYPNSIISAIGYSLGGNALLKYLGETSEQCHLRSAVAVSVPFELNKGALRLEKGFSRLYQSYLIGKLQRKFIDKFKDRKAPVDIKNIKNLNTFRKFDNQITAPLHGFKDVDDYYEKSSSRQYLGNITIPTLIVHAEDDPFMTHDAIPTPSELPVSVSLELSEHGGHVGFVGGTPIAPQYWLEKRIPDFIQSTLE